MKNFSLLLVAMAFSFVAAAQNATIRGFVYDEETGEPVIFTNVILEGTTYGASTDVNGFYSISKIPAGNYTILCSTLGFDTTKINVDLKKNQILSQKIILKKKSIDLQTFEVSAEKQEAKTEVKMSVQKVTPKETTEKKGSTKELASKKKVIKK